MVVFNLLEKSGFRTREHYDFMLNGLKQVSGTLQRLNIQFMLSADLPGKTLTELIEQLQPSELVFDFSPLNGPRTLQKQMASRLPCKVSVVDTHNIIPTWDLSDKEEYAAHTIRRKIHKQLDSWLTQHEAALPHPHSSNLNNLGITFEQADKHLIKLTKNGSSINFDSGEQAAKAELASFIDKRLPSYATLKNTPTADGQSNLSPYLHFGQISAQRVALEVMQQINTPPLLLRQPRLASFDGKPTLEDSVNVFLEELTVRKELADNYCFYNQNYTSLEGAKDWAKESLQKHSEDDRQHLYSQDEWRAAKTHDAAWNAAQLEMKQTGKMHGYMRMYWAKKLLEWSASPEEAIQTAVFLNDHYSLDGGDPNGYTGIMWSIAGVHDRPWFEREIYGKIRYMNRSGLQRRFDVGAYINRWSS